MTVKSFASAKGCREWLAAQGYEADTSSKKEVGIHWIWRKAGDEAKVTYGLLTRAGQSSRGAGACWGHKVILGA